MDPLRKQPEPTVVLQDQALRKLKGFTQVPNAILRHARLSHGAKLTFGVLLSYAWQDDFCHPAQEKLAKDMGCSIRQVRRFLVELRALQIVDWKQQGLNRPNVYYILPQARWSFDRTTAPDGTDLSAPEGTESTAPDRTPASVLERTPMSDKEYPEKNTHVDNVSQSISRKGKSTERPLTRDEYAKATALALQIQDSIGQPENYRSYFVRAAQAVRRGDRGVQALMEVLSATKETMRRGGPEKTPSQYFHGAWEKVLPTTGTVLPPTRPRRPDLRSDQRDGATAHLAVQRFLERPRTRRNHEDSQYG